MIRNAQNHPREAGGVILWVIVVLVVGVVAVWIFMPKTARTQVLKGKEAIEQAEKTSVEENWKLHWDDSIHALEVKLDELKKKEVEYRVEQKSLNNGVLALEKEAKSINSLIERYVTAIKTLKSANGSQTISVDGRKYDEPTLRNQIKSFLVKKKDTESHIVVEKKKEAKVSEIVVRVAASRDALQNKIQDLKNRKTELEGKEDLIATHQSLKELDALAEGALAEANTPEAKMLKDIENMMERKAIESEVLLDKDQGNGMISVDEALKSQVKSDLDNELEAQLEALMNP